MAIQLQEQVDTDMDSGPITDNIQHSYRIWKKNSPFLYDYLITHSLIWPSLTCQFFPDLYSSTNEDIEIQRLLIGTFTLGQQIDSISILQTPIPLLSNINHNKINFNNDKSEIEINNSQIPSIRIKTLQKINHNGDVNKLKYMPQKPNILASSNNLGNLVIYERTKHSNVNKTISDQLNKVQINLKNDRVESSVDIFALDWNKNKEGYLVSGDMNGILNLYDITKYKNDEMNQINYWNVDGGVNDVEWLPTHDSLISSITDTNLKIYDIRSNENIVNERYGLISGNSIAWNPSFATGFAIGDSAGYIKTYDLRNLKEVVGEFKVHNDSITQVKWHPKKHNILGSSSTDHSVKLHNFANETEPTFFQHLGHMLGVNDFDWSLADDWLLSSVGDDNSLHLWKPSSSVTKNL
ncbi:unnamed protein product [Candida verbasci]|uniref:Histone-binding protein RBBP4-like N-terminal domain-containing protein n=1 Tax=Candida verbasci TaxID=1227364 RepID=A0A9W4TVW6_9ASCO|nr:unnamed protein product [Candida verbasci]